MSAAEYEAHTARRDALIRDHGMPKPIAGDDALMLARDRTAGISPCVRAAEVYASIYRDQAAADAWLASNLEHHGHPAIGTVLMDDGRVIGILDLRPALARSAGLIKAEEDL